MSISLSQLMPQQVLCAALESIINQALRFNLNDNALLHALNDKTLSVYLEELGFTLTFSINSEVESNENGHRKDKTNRIHVLAHDIKHSTSNEVFSDCTLSTSLKTLWQLKQEQQLTELIKQGKLDLHGDIKVAQQFAALMENINIDWQSELAKHIGDIPTYQLGQFGLTLKQWLKNKGDFAARQISADASEWLIHEKRLLVTNYELTRFYQDVAVLDKQYQQLSERMARLNDAMNK